MDLSFVVPRGMVPLHLSSGKPILPTVFLSIRREQFFSDGNVTKGTESNRIGGIRNIRCGFSTKGGIFHIRGSGVMIKDHSHPQHDGVEVLDFYRRRPARQHGGRHDAIISVHIIQQGRVDNGRRFRFQWNHPRGHFDDFTHLKGSNRKDSPSKSFVVGRCHDRLTLLPWFERFLPSGIMDIRISVILIIMSHQRYHIHREEYEQPL